MSESFIAGFAYGATTVLVGQPLDTIKTHQQTHSPQISNVKTGNQLQSKSPSIRTISRNLYAAGGIPAFYRGGVPLLLGGGLMRSAQFGVYKSALQSIQSWQGKRTQPSDRICFGILDPQVVFAGFLGGIGRGMVEGPFEMVKVRRQVQTQWNFMEILKGSGTTLIRNSGLFMSFAIYMDISDQMGRLSPFWKGGICANLAWLTIWRECAKHFFSKILQFTLFYSNFFLFYNYVMTMMKLALDVTKSRLQSGKFEGKGLYHVLSDIIKKGHLFQGLLPGLTRSFIANGSSMVVYTHVETALKKQWRKE